MYVIFLKSMGFKFDIFLSKLSIKKNSPKVSCIQVLNRDDYFSGVTSFHWSSVRFGGRVLCASCPFLPVTLGEGAIDASINKESYRHFDFPF